MMNWIEIIFGLCLPLKQDQVLKKMKKAKALLLFSGGLDSILAAKILEKQGIDVTALTFVSYFFDANQAKKSAKENNIKLMISDISVPHLKIVKNPRHGRGSGMNPCIDCHLLMLKEAGKISNVAKLLRTKKYYSILATGEVLGQRPMSQNFRALKLIEKKAGLQGKILRPLSAKALPETEMEKSGLVNREKLLGISGRSRKEQLALAKKFGVKYFPTPAGGCVLTDSEFSKKLEELFDKKKKTKASDINLLRIGRHFWLGRSKIILGRNHEENLALKKLAEKNDILIEPKSIPGPTALVRGKTSKAVFDFARDLLHKYTKKASKDIELEIAKKK
jgi:tRNA-uridine 2-sulfurtransferase